MFYFRCFLSLPLLESSFILPNQPLKVCNTLWVGVGTVENKEGRSFPHKEQSREERAMRLLRSQQDRSQGKREQSVSKLPLLDSLPTTIPESPVR